MTMIHALIVSVILLVVLGVLTMQACRKSVRLRLMLLTVVAMLAVMCLRVPLFVNEGASVPAALVQSFAHALQAVTLSEDMDGPVDAGVALLAEEMTKSSVVNHEMPELSVPQALTVNLYRIYSVLLSILTPIFGSALVLEALAAFFLRRAQSPDMPPGASPGRASRVGRISTRTAGEIRLWVTVSK